MYDRLSETQYKEQQLNRQLTIDCANEKFVLPRGSSCRDHRAAMHKAKRPRRNGASTGKPKPAAEPQHPQADDHPTPAEVEEEEHAFVQLARKNWLKPGKRSAKVKVKNDVVKQGIWDHLEREGFSHKSLVLLESLQTLER